MNRRMLAAAIVVLAIGDGILHFALDFVFFRGNFFRNDLSIMFLLSFVGYVVLSGAFLLRERLLRDRAWLTNLVLIAYAVGSIVVWVQRGSPNPMGLGYVSKAIEVVLILALLAHWMASRRTSPIALAESTRGS